nr:MAG TPA: hypothetical protein [Caudoviricetes sp.]
MASKNSNYNIVVGVDFQKNEVQDKLDKLVKELEKKNEVNLKVNVGSSAEKNLKQIGEAAEDVNSAGGRIGITYQAANAILSKTVEIASSMVDQVYELDSAMTEFQKVSNLRGRDLDDYQQKLSEIGRTVARTGKPKCQARNVRIGN